MNTPLMPRIELLYIPCPSLKEAHAISSALLDSRLIACANIVESRSIYNWKGRREKGREFIIFAKTTPKKAQKAQKMVKKLHSYEIPCVLRFSVQANTGYAKWVASETKYSRPTK